ncbi:FMN-binding negative transcriptional regulator [Ramlibacter sp.]|uniref:FMN-binding negative transcriptional regulator n=1 Tax=Ramlibacter sp. TaxID=1917967 RepID=UPI002FCABBE5
MYLPPQFAARDPQLAATLIRENPLASLISCDDEGLPFVSHLPLHLDAREDGRVLLGHCARANPHWRYLQARPRALVTFLGPHAYLSPKVYPDLQRVPSWNYVAVHCTVQARLVDDAAGKDRLLKKLIADHEPPYAQQWRSLSEDFAGKLLAGIVGFELQVSDLQCKLKLNQHRPESHAALKTAYAGGNERERELANWMERIGIPG